MVLADDQLNGGANRERISAAFQGHNIMLGTNALLAPVAALAGAAPALGRAAGISPATRKDLLERLGAGRGTRMSVEGAEIGGQRYVRAVHTQEVALGSLDSRLKGVTVPAEVPVMVGDSGGRAAVMGLLPESVSTEHEVHTFVESLLSHGQIEFAPSGAHARAAIAKPASAKKPVARETHRVKTVGGKKVLERIRFHCEFGGCPARTR
jgi:hypothetical protein